MKARKADDNAAPSAAATSQRPSYWPVGMPVVLALGVAFVQAGSSGGMLAYRLIGDGLLAAGWMVAMTGLGWGLTRKLAVPLLLRLVTGAALGMGIVSLVVLGLGLAGWMNGVVAWVILLAGMVSAGWWIWKWRQSVAGSSAAAKDVVAKFNWQWLWIILMPFLGLALVGAATPPGLLWQDEPAGYDVTEYHLQVPREWYEAGKITGLKHNVFSYMPMNVEMHDLLAMHLRGGPWAGMYLGQFIHVAIMALAVLGAAGIAGALSDKPWAAPLAGAAMGVVPWVTSLAPIAYNEGGLMLFGGLAVGWAMVARDWRGWMVAGALAGLACGVKLTAGPLVVVGVGVVWMGLLLVGAVRRAPQAEPLKGLVGVGVFSLASVLVFAPWMVRNTIWTGNPVFPEAMEVLGKGHFSDAQMQRWRAAYVPKVGEKKVGERLNIAWERIAIDWRYGFLFLPLTVAAIVVLRDRRALFLALLLAVHLIIWLGFTHLQGRFFILVLPIGAVLIGLGRTREWSWVAGGLTVAMGLVGFLVLNDRYSAVRQWASTGILGVEDLKWYIELRSGLDVEKLPADRPILLVGDAQAFCYSGIPMKDLRYFTVFDVPAGDSGDWLGKWTGGGRGTVVVFPGELERLRTSYLSVPTPGKEALKGVPPYVVEK